MTNFKNNLRRKISKILFHYQWQLMFDLDNKDSKLYSDFKKIVPPEDRFWADPFVIFKDNIYYVFFEEFIYKKNKAHISFLTIKENGDYSKPKKILERPHHLSYPFIFTHNKKYYMIPESSTNNTIDAYECSEFPERWSFHTTLMENVIATDSTLFHKDGKWWLFTSVTRYQNQKRENELFLFYSDNPLSDKWISHPKNPIVSNSKGSRSAGKIFEENGKILRPAQDGSKRYGYGIIFYQINVLNEIDYQEKEIRTIYPWDKKIIGVHSYEQENKLTMIDIRIKKWR